MTQFLPWVLKYNPRSFSEIKGQDESLDQLTKFIQNKKKGSVCLIHGPPGTGKTSSVYVVAKDLNLEIVELNASDFRDKESIISIAGGASQQMSLFSKGKVILIDEVDGISGKKDRGAVTAIMEVVKKSAFPVVCIANDAYSDKLKPLRKEATLISFDALDYSSIAQILQDILKKENIVASDSSIKSISRRAGGDARAGISDLQVLTALGELNKEDIEVVSNRERVESIQDALMRVFKTTDVKTALGSYDYIPEDVKEIMLWLDNNLPKEYKNIEDLARAYNFLSEADIMNRRIMRRQHWRFLAYIYPYLSAGISISKDKKYDGFTKYERSMRPLRIWQANRKYAIRKSLGAQLAQDTHTSTKRVLESTLPSIIAALKLKKSALSKLVVDFGIDEEGQQWLGKQI